MKEWSAAAGSAPLRLSSGLLFDDLHAHEFVTLFFLQRLGDDPDGVVEVGDDDVLERVGPLLRFLDGFGQTVDGGLHLGHTPGQILDLGELDVGIVKGRGGVGEAVIGPQGRGVVRDAGQLHAHDRAPANRRG